MTEQERLEAFHKEIDEDEGLKSKRQAVIYLSLIIIAINLSSATIEKANTFLFEIHFARADGFSVLLAFSLLFCLIRYFNYSYKHTVKLSEFWKKRFIQDPKILFFHDDSEVFSGILAPIAQGIFDDKHHDLRSKVVSDFNNDYTTNWLPLKRIYSASWYDTRYDDELGESFNVRKEIGFINLFKLLKIEYTYRIEAYFRYPETLDLKAPFIIASLAYISILAKSKIPTFINLLG